MKTSVETVIVSDQQTDTELKENETGVTPTIKGVTDEATFQVHEDWNKKWICF